MAALFEFGKYGTFSGPGVPNAYQFDDSEPNWWKLDNLGSDFNLNDVAMVLLNTNTDYAYLKLNGYDTSTVTLGRSSGNIVNFNVNATTTTFAGTVTAPRINCPNILGVINIQAWKLFDIPHPNKPNKRLRHACIEGPEVAVYFRGRLKNSTIIHLPDYWEKLIDPESISVHLTQIGCSQDLMVERINWGKQIVIRSGNGVNIDCYYTVTATRIDVPTLEVEYEGTEVKIPEIK
jgi:hypothetical protein